MDEKELFELRKLRKAVIKSIRDSKNSFYGWVIAKKYKYGGDIKYNPIGKVYRDGTYSGYIYVYPTYKCAESELARLSNHSKLTIVRADVNIGTES